MDVSAFFIGYYFLQNASKFFAAFADNSEKNNAAAYDFSDFLPFPAFLSLSAVFNTSADLYKKNPAASLTFLQSSLFQNPIPGSSKSEYPEMGISKISRQKKPVNLFIMYPQYRKM